MISFLARLVPAWGWAALIAIAVATAGVWHVVEMRQARAEGRAAAELEMRQRADQDALERNARNERVTDAYIKQRDAVAHAAAGARAESERLREQLAALPAADPAAGAGADGAAPLAELLGSCGERYQAVAAEADRLAGQVRGLQNYARQVCVAHNPKEGGEP